MLDIIKNNSYLMHSLMPHSLFPPTESLSDLAGLDAKAWQTVTAGEPVAAAAWMLVAARLGHGDAQSILGQWLLDGHGVEREPHEALAWFLKAGTQGHVIGMNMAGRCFENGWGTSPDAFAAANWYRQAAYKGLEAGMYNYANMLASGRGVRKDPTAALEWYRRAARLGHAKSMTKIGHFYEDGRVVHKDAEAAFTWFEKGAAGRGFSRAVQLRQHAGRPGAASVSVGVAQKSAADSDARLQALGGGAVAAIAQP